MLGACRAGLPAVGGTGLLDVLTSLFRPYLPVLRKPLQCQHPTPTSCRTVYPGALLGEP